MRDLSLHRLDDTTWEIKKSGDMRVPGRILANEELLTPIRRDNAADQVANVACLPGIVGYAWAMPDAHWGYGFPIGGVAATDPARDGVISPGGVGYDINCGCRLMTTALDKDYITPRLKEVVAQLYRDIPCGVGSEGAIPRLGKQDLTRVLEHGSRWALENGYGNEADLLTTEEGGGMAGASADVVSERARERGANQLGTLGSGNHFAELGYVDEIFDPVAAEAYGLRKNGVTLMIHSGSRGLGYQVCDDFLGVMRKAAAKYEIPLPDRQLCCAPARSPEGREYFAAMAAAANFAWANRQLILELARRALEHALRISAFELGARHVYDVAHNIAKFERHMVDGVEKELCVHRKGATRSFPGERKEVPEKYRAVGQPVLVPGSMGTASYVCAGTQTALDMTFGSCCHGAGRMMSRSKAKKGSDAGELIRELERKGISVMARSKATLTEEAPEAYKNVDTVARVVHQAGVGRLVARLRPLGVIKG